REGEGEDEGESTHVRNASKGRPRAPPPRDRKAGCAACMGYECTERPRRRARNSVEPSRLRHKGLQDGFVGKCGVFAPLKATQGCATSGLTRPRREPSCRRDRKDLQCLRYPKPRKPTADARSSRTSRRPSIRGSATASRVPTAPASRPS